MRNTKLNLSNETHISYTTHRLSEQNIDGILKEVEGLYQSNSRNGEQDGGGKDEFKVIAHERTDVTTCITDMIIEGTCSSANLLESYVALHSAFLACLHKLHGPDVCQYYFAEPRRLISLIKGCIIKSGLLCSKSRVRLRELLFFERRGIK